MCGLFNGEIFLSTEVVKVSGKAFDLFECLSFAQGVVLTV